jgi:hypothetical protein
MSRLHERFRDHRSAISNSDLAEFLFIIFEEIMGKLQDLQAAVAAEDTVIQSAITLINGIAQRIIDAGGDPAALDALTADIQQQAASLAAAVQTNTGS